MKKESDEEAAGDHMPETVSFADMFDLNEIQKLQNAFSAATGVSSVITDPDGKPITHASGFCSLCWNVVRKTETGLSHCITTNKSMDVSSSEGTRIQTCMRSGLLNGEASIIVKGQHLANWTIGQIITEEQSEEELMPYADILGIDRELYRQEIRKVNRMSAQKFRDICDYLYINVQMLSKYAYETSQLSLEIRRRTEAERSLREANNQLEKWAEERTTFLEEKNYEQEDLIHLLEEEVVEREKSQRLYKELSLELENRVLERTRELDDRNKKLDEANALFAAIYESAPDVTLFALDREYRYLSFNRNHQDLMASLWKSEIALGINILEVLEGPENALQAKCDFDRALAGESFNRITVQDAENAVRTYWENHWSPIIRSDGEIIGLSCFALNITEQVRAEERLALSERLYSDIFHQSVIAVEIYDAEGLLVDANKACLDLIGVEDLKPLLGLSLFANPNLDYDMKIRLLHQETVHFTSDFDFERIQYHSKYHGQRNFEWRIAPVVYQNRTTGYICQVQDITDRRRFSRGSARPKWKL